MLLERFELSNFLSHKDSSIDLHSVSVFVGPCNSGKSAVFDGLLNLAQLASGRISQAFSAGPWSYAATLNRKAAPNGQIAFGAKFSKSAIGYNVAYRQEATAASDTLRYEIISESLLRNDTSLFDRSKDRLAPELAHIRNAIGEDTGVFAAIRGDRSTQTTVSEDLREVARNVSRIQKYRFEPSNLRRVGDIELDSRPRLRPKGERLASVLYYADKNGTISQLDQVLREVVPGFGAFEFNTTREQDVGFSIRFDDGRGRVNAARLSDGTLHFLGLATLLVLGAGDLPALICLEEPETGLNSAAMRKLIELIGDASERGSQIMISTHSPYLLAELWNRRFGNPFEYIHYVTNFKSGNGAGFSHVRPMAELVKNPKNNALRTPIDIHTAARLLDGLVEE